MVIVHPPEVSSPRLANEAVGARVQIRRAFYATMGSAFLAKIAVELQRALKEHQITGGAGSATASLLAQGDGWSVSDVICTSGPDDRPFEEQHRDVSISIIAAGTFQYRARSHKEARAHQELMTPGAVLLGNPGQAFECSHDHGSGDRCISFKYTPEFLETLVEVPTRFCISRLPPLRASAPLVARACAALAGTAGASWEELAVDVAVQAVQLANDSHCDDANAPDANVPVDAMARVTRAVRAIERNADAALPLQRLAKQATLSPYHFLRTFTRITGVTPHQFAMRVRLREAALRLTLNDARVIDVALDCGFGDLSNFNRSFRTEFGVAPRLYRRQQNHSV
jgi:AraC-like DNA-binding protein